MLVKTDTFNDTTDEPNETFTLSGTLTSNGAPYSDSGIATIIDNDETTTVVTAVASGPDHTVYEHGLLSVPDTTEIASGTFTVSASDGIASVNVGGTVLNFAALQALNSTNQTINTGEGTLVLTNYVGNAQGGAVSYTYTLNATIDNDSKVPGAGDSVSPTDYTDNVTVSVAGAGGSSASDTLSVLIVDDVPVAVDNNTDYNAVAQNTNLLVILDVSGSMNDQTGLSSGTDTLTRLELAQQAINELVGRYEDIGAVKVQLVTFSTDGATLTSGWVSAQEALDIINTLTDESMTNYDAGLHEAINSVFTDPGALYGGQNVSYFLSDGVPNTPSNDSGITGTEVTEWQNFLSANNIQSFALGMGPGLSATDLNPVAYNGQTDTDTNGVVIDDFANLTDALLSTVPSGFAGSIFQGSANGGLGADGGYVQSVQIDGTTYTYDGNTTVTGGGQFDPATKILAVTTIQGGTLEINVATGEYTYEPPAVAPTPVTPGVDPTDNMSFTVTDNDGDTASANLSVRFDTAPQIVDAAQSVVMTNEAGLSATADLGVDAGSDLVGASVTVSAANGLTQVMGTTSGGQSVQLTSGGNALVYQTVGGVLTAGYQSGLDFVPVFTVSGNAAGGTYSVNMIGTIDLVTQNVTATTTFTVPSSTSGTNIVLTQPLVSADGELTLSLSAFNDDGSGVGNPGDGIQSGTEANLTVEYDGSDASAAVNNPRLGVGNTADPVAISGTEMLVMSFNNTDGGGASIKTATVQTNALNSDEIVNWRAFEAGSQIAQGTMTGAGDSALATTTENSVTLDEKLTISTVAANDASATSGFGAPAPSATTTEAFGVGETEFDQLRLSAATGDDFSIQGGSVITVTYTTTQAVDVTLNFLAVVRDGDPAVNGLYDEVTTAFSVTLASDGTLAGGSASDVLVGGSGNETLLGGAGNDVLIGGGGNDIINGGAGTDTVSYTNAAAGVTVNLGTTTAQNTVGAGTDTITNVENLVGSNSADTLTGDAGNNVIEGGLGNDTLAGGGGVDTVSYAGAGGAVNVSLTSNTTTSGVGAAGNDTLSGFENIQGSDNNDTLTGDGAANVIEGGLGNDTIDGAGGSDTVSYANATGAVTVDLSTQGAAGTDTTGAEGTDTLSNVENVTGSAFNDVLTGDGSANVLTGGFGNDTLNGGGGADTLNGGVGNDTLVGGAGNDALNGGTGTDTISYAAAGAVTVNLSTNSATGDGTDTLNSVENVIGSGAVDTITGDGVANVLSGGGGNDTITGGLGSDTLVGGAGDDTLSGGDGNDTLVGGIGNDVLTGDAGTDTVAYTDATANGLVVNLTGQGAAGTDTSGGGLGTDTLATVENVLGSAFNDTITGDGNANVLNGGAGNDTISGGGGNDTITGGTGDDTLTGNAGADTFDWNLGDQGTEAAPGIDIVTDFTQGAGNDVLDLADLLVGEHASGASLDPYLNITDGTTPSVISTSSDADAQKELDISLTGVNLSGDDAAIIAALLAANNLKTDP
ncbi:MAG: type I secretion C-terminal target domain-containing protein [Hydrogenophilales bacterium]|nr:type I secretion C-terminal target domain-containing protein [Hydrogenophilales bacterium]